MVWPFIFTESGLLRTSKKKKKVNSLTVEAFIYRGRKKKKGCFLVLVPNFPRQISYPSFRRHVKPVLHLSIVVAGSCQLEFGDGSNRMTNIGLLSHFYNN